MTKEIPCPVCEGRGFVNWCNSTTEGSCQAGSKTCQHCNGSGIREVPMTNGDRIRAMTDEELSAFFGRLGFCNIIPRKYCRTQKVCSLRCVTNWLKQPAKEGG